jgi:hypothetical protein
MGGDVTVRSFAQFVCKAFCEAFDRCFGCVVRSVSTARKYDEDKLLVMNLGLRGGATYGGLVIPCLDPVLMITDWFSWWSMDWCNVDVSVTFGAMRVDSSPERTSAAHSQFCIPHQKRKQPLSTSSRKFRGEWYAPKEIDIKHLPPILDAVPRCALDTGASIVHEHRDLDEHKHIYR